MPRFRPSPVIAALPPPSLDTLRHLIAEVLRPANFFLASEFELISEHVEQQQISWEVFQGRLLDPSHTRRKAAFESWSHYLIRHGVRSEEPLLSVKLGTDLRLYIVRGLECYVWESYDEGSNIILSRERRKWVRELTGIVELARFADSEELADELISQVFHAVVGASRLPLSSVEAPLPAFSFGELFYAYRPDVEPREPPLRGWRGLLTGMDAASLNRREKAKWLETYLHAMPREEWREEFDVAVEALASFKPVANRLLDVLQTLYNEVSLSPYTDLVEKTLALLRGLEAGRHITTGEVVDFLGWLLRQIGRHLTAYDLVTFHHRGANYPDALLLDAILKEYLALAGWFPNLFRGDGPPARLRRRALRQGWLLRRRYEGHPVPDVPTSPGENSRVLPRGGRVPEEQILQPARRKRRLYSGEPPLCPEAFPHVADILTMGVRDLVRPSELREMGIGLFLDRPLGTDKPPAEPDNTPLLSTLAFSRSIALQRLDALARESGLTIEPEFLADCRRRLDEGEVQGVSLESVPGDSRPGKVSLADARRAAPDFVLLWTTRGSVADLLELFDFSLLRDRLNLDYLAPDRRLLLVATRAGPGILIHDAMNRPRLELIASVEEGYTTRAGQEFPVAGLRVMRAWDQEGHPCDLGNVIRLPPNHGFD
jgi:hypothetical protein